MTAAARLADTPVLVTDRLSLHAPGLADFDAYAGFMAAPRSAGVGGIMTRSVAWRYFGHHVGHWVLRGYGTFFFAPRGGGPALGMVMCWQPEGYPEREIGWTVFADADEGRGYVTEAARAVLAHVFGTLGWTTAVSYVTTGNARSAAVARRLGARHDPGAAVPDPADPGEVWRHSPGGAA